MFLLSCFHVSVLSESGCYSIHAMINFASPVFNYAAKCNSDYADFQNSFEARKNCNNPSGGLCLIKIDIILFLSVRKEPKIDTGKAA